MYRHFKRMTDDTGILQFSERETPLIDSGYTVDDNARAMIVAMGMERGERERLLNIYCRFLVSAQDQEGHWQNLKVHKEFLPVINSEDSIGRGVLAASLVAQCGISETERMAFSMLEKALPGALRISSPRAMAYVLLGMINLINRQGWYWLFSRAKDTAERLMEMYKASRSKEWLWFEDRLTYCNALLPHSLFGYYMLCGDSKASAVAGETLRFLTDSLLQKGYLNIVGNRGWWKRETNLPDYDQQPVDAASIVLACLQAFVATGEREYLEKAQLGFDWYWGNNINKIPLYNSNTQGCHDALVPDGVNLNQGAEAVISFLMAHQVLHRIKQGRPSSVIPAV